MKIVQENRDEMPCHGSEVYELQNLGRSVRYPNFMNYKLSKIYSGFACIVSRENWEVQHIKCSICSQAQ